MRAIVHFHNGFSLSPGIETSHEDLLEDLTSVLRRREDHMVSVARVSGCFVAERYAKHGAQLLNVERSGSYGIKRTFCENPAHWPGKGDQFGVIFANVETGEIEWWGGPGFSEGGFNPAQVRSVTIELEEA